MNPHIKVINENLWAVNFSYVKMGYIQELTFNNTNEEDAICLMNDGRLILNSAFPQYSQCVPYIKEVMKLPSRKLYTKSGFVDVLKNMFPSLKLFSINAIEQFIRQNNLYLLKNVFLNVCSWEMQRRKLQKALIQDKKTFDMKLIFENYKERQMK